MCFLGADVADDRGQERMADAEGGVIFLPGKFRAVLSHPPGGVRFDGVDGFGERGVGGNLNQEVEVIGSATDGMAEDFLVTADADDVVPEARAKRRGYGWGAIFGGEDDVNDVLDVSVGHNESGI